MINKDSRSTKQQLENIDTVTTNRKEQQQLAQLHILGTAGSMGQSPKAHKCLKWSSKKQRNTKQTHTYLNCGPFNEIMNAACDYQVTNPSINSTNTFFEMSANLNAALNN